jgi:hypothetical protein
MRSIPITVITVLSFSDIACSPCQRNLLVGREHGRTIPLPELPPPHSIGIDVGIENDATWWTMGQASKPVAISVGDYVRIFPVANLRKALEPVLHACGNHW